MPTLEELLEQKRDIEQRKHELETYLMKARQIQGDINEITYRENSWIEVTHEKSQSKSSLKEELKEKNAELKQLHQLPPHRVRQQISEYDSALSTLNRHLSEMEKRDTAQALKVENLGQNQPESGAVRQPIAEGRERLQGLETRLTETGVGLLSQQAAQETPEHHSRIPSPDSGQKPSFGEQLAESARQHLERRRQERSRDDGRNR